MTIHAQLARRLVASSTRLTSSQVHRFAPPQNATLPAASYVRTGLELLRSTTGVVGQAVSYFTITAWSSQADVVEAVAADIRGGMATWVSSTAGVEDAHVVGDQDLDVPEARQAGLYQVPIDVELYHTEL